MGKQKKTKKYGNTGKSVFPLWISVCGSNRRRFYENPPPHRIGYARSSQIRRNGGNIQFSFINALFTAVCRGFAVAEMAAEFTIAADTAS